MFSSDLCSFCFSYQCFTLTIFSVSVQDTRRGYGFCICCIFSHHSWSFAAVIHVMFRVAVSFCFVVSVFGLVPDMNFVRERGNEIAKMAMNKQMSVSHLFEPNARACFNGDCSAGPSVYDSYRDKFQQFSIDYTNLVARGTTLYTIVFLQLLQLFRWNGVC